MDRKALIAAIKVNWPCISPDVSGEQYNCLTIVKVLSVSFAGTILLQQYDYMCWHEFNLIKSHAFYFVKHVIREVLIRLK